MKVVLAALVCSLSLGTCLAQQNPWINWTPYSHQPGAAPQLYNEHRWLGDSSGATSVSAMRNFYEAQRVVRCWTESRVITIPMTVFVPEARGAQLIWKAVTQMTNKVVYEQRCN